MSVCDSLSDGSLSDSLSYQLVELYHPAIRNEMLMVTLLPLHAATEMRKELETADSLANAYTVAMGENPRNIDYNQSTM